MPPTSFSPYEPGGGNTFDPVGQSIDWSAYHALSPGGRFPGDTEMFMEWLAASDPAAGRDPASPNPDFAMPEWLKNSKLGFIFRQLERDQQAGGLGPVSNPLEAGPAYFPWSGPGARYGPEGGPLHGLLDQGGDRLGDRDYGPDVNQDPGPAPRGKGGGGGGEAFAFNFQPYAGTPFQSSFVDWQPTRPFHSASEPTRFVPGAAGLPRIAAPPPMPPAAGGGGGGGGRGPVGGGGAGGAGRPGMPRPAAGTTPRTPTRPGQPSTPAELLNLLFPPGSRAPHAGAAFREGGQRGYDVGMLDKGSPGWTRDPTTGILNTAGFPLPTPESPRAGESADAYMTRLHDQGYDNESILGMLSGWGTGQVMRDPNTGELVFAKDATAWVGPDSGERRQTDIYFQGKSPEQLEEEDRQAGIGREMSGFLRGGGGGFNDFLSGMFNFGGNPLF